VTLRFRTPLGSLAKSEFLFKCGNLTPDYTGVHQQRKLAKLGGTAETSTSGLPVVLSPLHQQPLGATPGYKATSWRQMPEGNSYLLWQGFSAVMILSVSGIKGGTLATPRI